MIFVRKISTFKPTTKDTDILRARNVYNALIAIVVIVCGGTLLALINFYYGAESILLVTDRSNRSVRSGQLVFQLESCLHQLETYHSTIILQDNGKELIPIDSVAQLVGSTIRELKVNEASNVEATEVILELESAANQFMTRLRSRPDDRNQSKVLTKSSFEGDLLFLRSLLNFLEQNANAELSNSRQKMIREERGTKIRVLAISGLITLLVIALSIVIRNTIRNKVTAEQRLKALHDHNIELFENSPCGYLVFDGNGLILQMNATELNRLGKSRSQVVQRLRIFDLIHPDYHEKSHSYIEQLNATGKLTDISVPLVNDNGSTYWVRTNATSEKTSNGQTLYKVNTVEITESRHNLEKVRFQSKLLEECNDAIISVDLETRVTSWNKGAERMYGYQESEALGIKVNDLVGLDKPFSATELEAMITALLSNKRLIGERTHHNKAGEKINVLYSISPLMNERGEIIGAVSVFQDISLRKRFEEQLMDFNISLEQKVRENTEEFKQLVTGISDAFIALDHQLRVKFLNMKAAELLEGQPGDFLGHYLTKSTSIPNASVWIEFLQRVLLSKQPETFELKCSESVTSYMCRAYPTESGITLLIENSTERLRAQQLLQESEEKYRLFFENSPLPLYIFELTNLQVVDANMAACRQYGYDKEQLIGISALDMVQSHDQQSVREHLQAISEGKRFEGTCIHQRKDRTPIQVEMFSETIHRNGKEYRLVLAYDISARVAAEEELKRSRDEFRKLNQHLENIREEERTKIARELHDEIGQQMTVMKMDLALLLRKATRDESRVTLNGMIALADTTIATIRRISSSLRPGILDDLGLLSAIQWHCKEMSSHAKIPIRVISDGTDYDFDPETNTAIFRIVQESLTNILRHAKASYIEIDVHTADDCWMITVRDNGIGFDEDPALHGLGLLGMRERARALNAKLDLTSRPGFGTELRLSLPLACPMGTVDQPIHQLDAYTAD